MQVSEQDVRQLFERLEQGDSESFFERVADDVDWTVTGTHPLAGHYRSKSDFIAGTFAKLAPLLPGGVQLRVVHLHVVDNHATVEMRSMATATNGMRFDNHYCWVVRFQKGHIVEVRAYLDSALVTALLLAENKR